MMSERERERERERGFSEFGLLMNAEFGCILNHKTFEHFESVF